MRLPATMGLVVEQMRENVGDGLLVSDAGRCAMGEGLR